MEYYYISYGITFLAIIITLIAQGFISIAYGKYSKIKNTKGITGSEAARKILDKNNLSDVEVVPVNGYLTDHYDPQSKVVRLSKNNYSGSSVASVAVACHECGHAIQDKENYAFMRLRAALVPLVNFSSKAGYIAIFIGVLFSSLNIIWLGIALELVILLFQLVTLPVEIDASKRALKELENTNILSDNELSKSKLVLTAAALTYVASVATTLLEILRLILLYGRKDD